MLEKIKRLGTDTAIYGISTVIGRFLTFLLMPIYVNIIPVSDVGIVATVYAYIAFLNVLYSYGMDAAYMKYTSTRELGDDKQTFTVPFFSVGITSIIFSALIIWYSAQLTEVINLPPSYQPVLLYAAGILCLDAIAIVPFASLRMAGKAKKFAAIKMINIIVNVACNVLFLIKYEMGVEGIFLSGIISSALTLLMLAPTVLSSISFAWPQKLYRSLLQFGLPYIPASLATMMIQVIDRPILEALTDKATVGIYQANYRLGVFMMLVVSMFDFAWRPFFLSHARDTDAKQLFARILTYFFLLMAGVFLLLSFFLEDVVKLPIFWGRSILPELYWTGLSIVPVVLLAYVFLGISNNIVAGIHIEKKTKHLPAIAFIGAFVNVTANLLLIPLWNIMGAAVATLLGYAIMAVVMYFIVQQFYPVQYEFIRIIKIAIAATIVFGLFNFVKLDSYELVWKVILLLLFIGIMYWMRFFEAEELRTFAKFFERREAPVHEAGFPPDTEA